MHRAFTISSSIFLIRLFDISVISSSILNKIKLVTCSFKSSTSLNKSEFTIVAEPYRSVDEILIYIYIVVVYIIFLSVDGWVGGWVGEGGNSDFDLIFFCYEVFAKQNKNFFPAITTQSQLCFPCTAH
jgi:hypothetical protein